VVRGGKEPPPPPPIQPPPPPPLGGCGDGGAGDGGAGDGGAGDGGAGDGGASDGGAGEGEGDVGGAGEGVGEVAGTYGSITMVKVSETVDHPALPEPCVMVNVKVPSVVGVPESVSSKVAGLTLRVKPGGKVPEVTSGATTGIKP